MHEVENLFQSNNFNNAIKEEASPVFGGRGRERAQNDSSRNVQVPTFVREIDQLIHLDNGRILSFNYSS